MRRKILICFIIICSILIVNINIFSTYAESEYDGVDSSYGRGGVKESGDKISIKYELDKPNLVGSDKGDSSAYNAFSKYYNEKTKIWTFSKSDVSNMKQYAEAIYVSGTGDIIEQRKIVQRVLKLGIELLNGNYSEDKMLKYNKDDISEYIIDFGIIGVNNNIAEAWYKTLEDSDSRIGTLKDVAKLLSNDTKKTFDADEIKTYVDRFGTDDESKEVLDAWEKTIIESNNSYYQDILEEINPDTDIELGNGELYKLPERNANQTNSEESLEDMISDADSFVNQGSVKYNDAALQNFSKTFYNIMLTVGVFAAAIVGGILGIRLMLASASEKAEAKKMLVPYVVGCFIIFGGFAIWKIALTILEGI